MLNLRTAAVLAVAFLLQACTSLPSAIRASSQIPITVHNNSKELAESGAVYLWPPHSSAALVDGKGNRCVLAASGARSVDASSEAALKIGKALEKIEGLEASTKTKLVESFTKISASDNHAAFADIALFHLCMLDQNGTFKEGEKGKSKMIMDAYLKTVEAAKSLP
jgi:hypothetical protein